MLENILAATASFLTGAPLILREKKTKKQNFNIIFSFFLFLFLEEILIQLKTVVDAAEAELSNGIGYDLLQCCNGQEICDRSCIVVLVKSVSLPGPLHFPVQYSKVKRLYMLGLYA